MKYVLPFFIFIFSIPLSWAQNPPTNPAVYDHWIDELLKVAGANGPVVVDDDFSSNQTNWYIGIDSVAAGKIEDHHYKIRPAKAHQTIFVTHAFNVSDNHDWKVEAEMMNTGNDEKSGYGIIFGSSAKSKNYFEIANSGAAIWVKDGATMDSKDVLQYMNTGVGEMNKLTVQHVIRRDEWSFRLNDEEIFASKNYSFSGNGFGFITETEASVGHFRIYDWSKSQETPDSIKESDYSSDFFSSFHPDDKNWNLDNDEDISSALVADAMRQELKSDITYSINQQIRTISSKGDYRIDLLFSRISTRDTANTSGIVFKKTDNDNQFYFAINGGSQCKLFELKKGDWNAISDWITTKAIKNGNDAANLLSVEAKNKRWYFRINGTTVYSCAEPWSDGELYGWRLEGIEAIKVKSFNVCQAHIPTIKYFTEEEDKEMNAPFDETKFLKQITELMCDAPNGFTKYVGEVNDRGDNGYIAYDSKMFFPGVVAFRFYEHEKSGAGIRFEVRKRYIFKKEAEEAFDHYAARIDTLQSPCFTLERINEKNKDESIYPKVLVWQDPKTRERIELKLFTWGDNEQRDIMIELGKKEK